DGTERILRFRRRFAYVSLWADLQVLEQPLQSVIDHGANRLHDRPRVAGQLRELVRGLDGIGKEQPDECSRNGHSDQSDYRRQAHTPADEFHVGSVYQHDLAELGPGFEVSMGLCGIGQRKGPIDDGPQYSSEKQLGRTEELRLASHVTAEQR